MRPKTGTVDSVGRVLSFFNREAFVSRKRNKTGGICGKKQQSPDAIRGTCRSTARACASTAGGYAHVLQRCQSYDTKMHAMMHTSCTSYIVGGGMAWFGLENFEGTEWWQGPVPLACATRYLFVNGITHIKHLVCIPVLPCIYSSSTKYVSRRGITK